VTGNEKSAKFWSGNDIRSAFLKFFEQKGHKIVRSSSLVPHGDPTLLFTNAGMNQFKDVFLGLEKREYTRATTAQKCVRAGGKHNDLENVGFTKRHHTFFEMLGNFSFGDYFKKEAIAYAWELVTSPEWFAIDKNKLYVTVFGGAEVSPGNTLGVDEEAKWFWLEQNVPADRVFEISGLKDNFWAMGDTGPCGPCSEIFYDMGPAASEEDHADCKFPCDCGRYVEIWNLVFMQYNRVTIPYPEGVIVASPRFALVPLPNPCVDTGMGLERTAAVLQSVISNYDTDLFLPLVKRAAELCGVDFSKEEALEEGKGGAASLRVIVDHARATTFLIADGVLPSNEGRGYVLRKIMRRAILHSQMLSERQGTLGQMVPVVIGLMKSAYAELVADEGRITDHVRNEERRFGRTLKEGLGRLEDDIYLPLLKAERPGPGDALVRTEVVRRSERADLHRRIAEIKEGGGRVVYPGKSAFRLYDTFGLPLDLIQDAVRDFGLDFDPAGFETAMQEQRTKARASWKGTHKEAANPAYAKLAETFKTEPCFYFGTSGKDCRIEAIFRSAGVSPAGVAEGKEPAGGRRYEIANELKAGESGEVVLDRTVIYAESGGQVADTGTFYDNSESQELAEVKGAFYPVAGLIAHKVVAKETLRVGDRVAVVADAERRARIIRNHTGTHLVHAALRNILGTHVKQAGSLNAPERLRFDFSHFAHVDAEELRDIEQQVNEEIRLNMEIETNVTSLEDALASGALAFFGDKYPEHNVRVVTIPDPRAARGFYSKELCGGTHVQRVGDIGVLKIVSEESVAAGVRRVEAVTGIGALEHYQQQAQILKQLAAQLNVGEDAVLAQVEKLTQTAKQLEKELEAQKRKGGLSQFEDLESLIRESREKVAKEAMVRGNAQVRLVKDVKLALSQVENVDKKTLREIMDKLRQEIRSGVIVLASVENGDISLIAGVTKDLTAKVHAGKLIQALAKQLGGSGGGRPDLAEAGGKDTAGLKTALQTVPSLIEPLL
jgi:alanyl-tRNA synthetase